jgi:hypothetical protein
MKNTGNGYNEYSNSHLEELEFLKEQLREQTRARRHCPFCCTNGWRMKPQYSEIYKNEIDVAYRCECYISWQRVANALLVELNKDIKRGDEPIELPDWAFDHHKVTNPTDKMYFNHPKMVAARQMFANMDIVKDVREIVQPDPNYSEQVVFTESLPDAMEEFSPTDDTNYPW